ncbi:hypothetical protein NK8_64860 (plasmid) [Caballeronia sp. NK8]|nr:hypothetical protein NK8_64860 [Caballeronia sp. NK8]
MRAVAIQDECGKGCGGERFGAQWDDACLQSEAAGGKYEIPISESAASCRGGVFELRCIGSDIVIAGNRNECGNPGIFRDFQVFYFTIIHLVMLIQIAFLQRCLPCENIRRGLLGQPRQMGIKQNLKGCIKKTHS